MNLMPRVRSLCLYLLTSLAISPAQAYFSTIDNGDLVAPGAYQVSFEPQILFSGINGMNAVARLDAGMTQESSARLLIGVGKVDFQLGGFYKIIPFPDTANQPAIGADVGLLIAKVGGETETSVRFHPLISKQFETEIGDILPYVSLPVGVTWRSGAETFFPVQLAVGSELRLLNYPNLSFFAEVGININRAFSYLSGAIAYRFDDMSIHRHGNRR